MKTTNQILTDIWNIARNFPAISALNGGVYKKIRPTGSVLNDCVISLITGISGKFINDGAILIKLFYNDINQNNTYYEDSATGQTFEQILIELSEILLNTNGYSFQIETREHYTEAIEEIHQHYAILKINFQILQN